MATALQVAGLDGEPVPISATAIDTLSSRIDGAVLQAGDVRYDDAVRIWNGMITKRPALAIQPVSAQDVSEVVGFVRANGLQLSVKGGGHGISGSSLTDGGVTLDMSGLRAVVVDPDRRLAHVQPGCLLGDVDSATQEYGLATVLGSDADTGAAGLTLGGGFGHLTRRFGWTVDNLEEVEIVTADGVIRRAGGRAQEDLFWAVRGGGGNFGVVTEFVFRLHEVGPVVTGGLIAWGADDAGEILRLYREVTASAPRELTLVLTMRIAPPAPFLPERWHGRPVIGIIACHTGDLDAAARDLAPIRNTGTPIVDLITQKRYVDQQFMLAVPQPKGLHYYWKSEFLAALPDPFLDEFERRAAGIPAPQSQFIIFQLGGAVADHEESATAFGNRDADHILFAAGCWQPDAPEPARYRDWVRSAWSALRPYSTGGNYVNVQTADEDESRTRDAYGASFEQLARIKAAYDPDNLFRVNRNVAPAALTT